MSETIDLEEAPTVRPADKTARAAAMPDVHATVTTATEVARERGMPLRTEAIGDGNVTSAANRSDSQGESSPGAFLEAEPWSRLPRDIACHVRKVDIAHTLGGIAAQMKAVDTEIERLITTPVKLIADVAVHTLGAGGKRLRPALVILAAQLCGDAPAAADARVITCAAAVELIHTTSLIHDDVVDSATVRRGKPAANLVWGNETSILVGDYLFAQVFVTVSQPGFHDVSAAIAHATSQLCAGELLETQTRGLLTMKDSQYCDIVALKTAALTECACRLGALALGASEDEVERLARYGREIGMAFQIVDDVFDITGSTGRLGKPIGNDIREGDITLPMLRAMQTCTETEQDELKSIIGREGITEAEVQRAIAIISGGDAVPHCLGVAAAYIESAKSQIAAFAPSPARDVLSDIADYVLSRDR